ncbi:dipeptidase [Hoyosella altamirensis]|uniref:Membrane dipeptidase n=1 Tax=Hoyosella altamirensis TaxID=616997 RepID=A0A839RGQ1_9ACTN|nr:membrane dipeptidase [Hoyosella altamirensis]MBB3035902.1 membrane dipeptidase [Hoyosella altamirensis]
MDQPLWEQHCCLPLSAAANVGDLAAYGPAFVSVNVGYALHDKVECLAVIDHFRAGIEADERLTTATTYEATEHAARQGKTAIAFDLEDARPLAGDLANVELFYRRGVRTLLPTYNFANDAGSGCLDETDRGLTAYGRDLVSEMNRIGMVVDGSHCSTRTGLGLSEASKQPMIYSHSCMRSVWKHERNITDERAVACAETGGVVGITGVGIFLGANDASIDAMIRHIDYAVELIGEDHVGVASDFPFDYDDFRAEMLSNPHFFPAAYTRYGPIDFVTPAMMLQLPGALKAHGYSTGVIRKILWGNFARIAAQVWK